MKIIAVAGASGSGKTLFSKLLAERLPKCSILPMDSYYHDKPEEIPLDQYNLNVPQALNFKGFHRDLEILISGLPVKISSFNYAEGKHNRDSLKIQPGEYLIIEGLHILMHASIRSKFSYSFYLETPLDVAVCRRLMRDTEERDIAANLSMQHYLNFVRPAYYSYVRSSRQFASLVVKNDYLSSLERFIDDFLRKYHL